MSVLDIIKCCLAQGPILTPLKFWFHICYAWTKSLNVSLSTLMGQVLCSGWFKWTICLYFGEQFTKFIRKYKYKQTENPAREDGIGQTVCGCRMEWDFFFKNSPMHISTPNCLYVICKTITVYTDQDIV